MKQMLFTIIAIFAISFNSFSQEKWELEKDKNGIQVYTRPVKGSDVREYKAYVTIKGKDITPEKVLKVINDANKFKDWIDKVEYSKLIKQVSPTTNIVYLQIGMPIGISDRDLVLKNVLKKLKNGGYKKEVTSAYNQYPEQEDFIRIKKAYGKWLILPVKGGVKVVYQFFSEPGGSLPTWVVNMFLVDGPYNTLSNLKEMFND